MANIDIIDFSRVIDGYLEIELSELSVSHPLEIGQKFRFCDKRVISQSLPPLSSQSCIEFDLIRETDQESSQSGSQSGTALLFQAEANLGIEQAINDEVFELIKISNKLIFKQIISRKVIVSKSINLFIGLPRPRMLKKILEVAPLFPIKNIFVIKTDLSDPSFLLSKELGYSGIEKSLYYGVKQSGLGWAPRVSLEFNLTSFDVLLDKSLGFKILSDLRGEYSVKSLLSLGPDSLDFVRNNGFDLFIGPERGWSKSELKSFRKHQFYSLTQGKEIFQTDLAVITFCSQLGLVYDIIAN